MSDDLSVKYGDRRLVQGLFLALKSFSNLRDDDNTPLRLVNTFLAIAMDEGKCANQYAQALDVHRYAMSRYVHELADRDRNGGPGLELVRIVPEKSGRSNRQNIFLTAKGRAVANEMLRPLRAPQTSEAA
jgi:hypothetical protein